jgi:protocatechuate 3,4-dioxygenase beta subunit
MHLITPRTLDLRRRAILKLAAGGAFYSMSGLLAEALTLTPRVTQGPFYPMARNIPLDKDNDLVLMNDSLTPASGVITYVSGRVLDSKGQPIRDALVELWHADSRGEYIFSADSERNPRADRNFAGFGQFLTGSDGGYKFRTVKAGLYRGRARHFHFGITVPGQKSRFTTQLFWKEDPNEHGESGMTNEQDGVYSGIRDAAERESLVKVYTPVPGSSSGEVETTWDMVMGITPVEQPYPNAEGSHLVVAGQPLNNAGGKPRFKVSVAAQKGYSYEVYANPTMGNLGWAALPFAMNATSKVDRNIHTADREGTLDLFVEKPSVKGFYYVAFRVPGANTGTPGIEGGRMRGPGGPGGPPPPGGRGGPPPGGGRFGGPPGPPPDEVSLLDLLPPLGAK